MVEHDLAKVGVASSSLVFRSKTKRQPLWLAFLFCEETERSDPIPPSALSIIWVVQGEGHDEAASFAVVGVKFEVASKEENVSFG